MSPNKPLLLMILDGWGYNPYDKYNAIAKAHTPQWDEWWQNYPHILLDASGIPVGLPDQQMGNSEVGHMHIGAGRIIQQDFTRINQAIENGEFEANPLLNQLIDTTQLLNKTLHVMGLLSPGGVHSHEKHLFAFLKLCHKKNVRSLALHLFLDGRDTPPQSALESLDRLKKMLDSYSVGSIKSICGRYYAMDRDSRWERIEPVYSMLTEGNSPYHYSDAKTAIEAFYQQNLDDEFIPPTQIGQTQIMEDGDSILFFNFRADRARQLSAAFLNPEFQGFKRLKQPALACFASMTLYDENLPSKAVFPPVSMSNTLGEVIADKGLKQLRIAETEKYAHVTFFLNGGKEQVCSNETRIMIPSPKIATYDLQPEMSAPELTTALIEAINQKSYDVIICNYANADMVGHTGNFDATVRAIECLDSCMSQVWQALSKQQGILLITADHGNAEEMFNEYTHQAHTAHTSEPVPFVCVSKQWYFTQQHGSLIDIAPTLLSLLGITPPKEMSGHILLKKINTLPEPIQ